MAKKVAIQDYFIIIGQISVSFVRLETWLRFFVIELISGDFEANTRILAGEPFKNLCFMFRTLFKYRVKEKDENEKLDELMEKLFNINDDRNTYIHSDWILVETQTTSITRRAKLTKGTKQGLKLDAKDDDFDGLKEYSERIGNAIEELTALTNRNRETYLKHRSDNASKKSIKFNKDGIVEP